MNVGSVHGIITLIYTCLLGAIFSTTVIYSPVLKSGQNKLNVANTSLNEPYFICCYCVFYCSDGLLLLGEAVSLWGWFDAGTKLEIRCSKTTEGTVKYMCVGKSTSFYFLWIMVLCECGKKWNLIYNREKIIKFKSKNSNRSACGRCGAVGEHGCIIKTSELWFPIPEICTS